MGLQDYFSQSSTHICIAPKKKTSHTCWQ
uniref:Uncharacterized protein n=1 Tax=Anguilla anguilla TaxID=7936 RepID=A0A0E9SZ14_ANGAN